MEFLAKGKRGLVYVFEENADGKSRKVCVKERNPESSVDSLWIEAKFLELVNKKKIGPKLYKFEDGKLFMEFIEGERIGDFLERAEAESIKGVIGEVLRQCFELDKMGVEKSEMTNPYKHVIVRSGNEKRSEKESEKESEKTGGWKGRVVLIDFERARFREKPGNVTQFLQYLMSRNVFEVLEKNGIKFDRKKAREAAREYKSEHSRDAFLKLADVLGLGQYL